MKLHWFLYFSMFSPSISFQEISNEWYHNVPEINKYLIDSIYEHDKYFSQIYIFNMAKKFQWCGALVQTFSKNKELYYILFKNELNTLIDLSNKLSRFHITLPISISQRLDNNFYSNVLREFLDNNNKIYCGAIVLDPSYLNEVNGFINNKNVISSNICRSVNNIDSFIYTNLAMESKLQYAMNNTIGFEWYWKLRKDYSFMLWDHRHMCEYNLTKIIFPNWISIDDILINKAHFDCSSMDYSSWLLPFSLPFFGCSKQRQLVFRGVVRLDIKLDKHILKPCVKEESLFAQDHRCIPYSTCKETIENFESEYICECNEGYYIPSKKIEYNLTNFFPGSLLEQSYIETLLNKSKISSYECVPCDIGCNFCDINGVCLLEFDFLTRGIPFAIECATIFCGVVLLVIIARMRINRVIKTSFWLFLEIIILGAITLHTTVLLQYFGATATSCLMLIWLKELGCTALYCSLTLKLLHYLSQFQSRKAHRVQVKDTDLLKQLCIAIFVVAGYLATWTMAILDSNENINSLLSQDGYMNVCAHRWHHFAIDAAELTFLIFSLYICYRARSAPSPYFEVHYIFISMHIEVFVAITYYILRTFLHSWLQADHIFLMLFLRHQFSTTITITLVVGSKFWFLRYPPREKQSCSRVCSEDIQSIPPSPPPHKVIEKKTSEGVNDLSSINLPGVTLEDIGCELKRLHKQMNIYKTRLRAQDAHNATKSKSMSQRCKSGQGRRFSIQAFYSQHQGSFRSKGRSYQTQQSTGSSLGPDVSPQHLP